MGERVERLRLAGPMLAVAALFSGAALLAAIAFHLSLGLTLGCACALALGATIILARTLPRSAAREFVARAVAGAVAGIVGVACYDGVRTIVVHVFHLAFNPFGAFPTFGRLITGADAHSPVIWVVGTLYHYLNGVMFGVSYGIAFGRSSWCYGIGFALALEALMLAVYPTFLDLAAVRAEFTAISMIGHVAYGSALGLVTAELMRRRAPLRPSLGPCSGS